jgi:hypothetical protein
MQASLVLALALPLTLAPAIQKSAGDEVSPLTFALDGAERALDAGDLARARELLVRALERDAKSLRAWELRARLAEAAEDRDERVWSLHRLWQLTVAQKLPREQLNARRAQLLAADPLAADLLGLTDVFEKRLLALAEQYEKDERPHSAIRVHKELLALRPEREASREAIERLAATPDPSLAGFAKPKDLFADVSAEWIRDFNAQHDTWSKRAKLERESYVTSTDAGYETLVRAAEAMEQMNAFYRQFFRYGTHEDKRSVSRIELLIFKSRDEYLKLGSGPPAEWSGGQFTGGSVETYVSDGGFSGMVGTLFHEAAHQFVSLATNASGWLNEGLASFFEGTRILANGTVIMNMPANHRLFPLVERMERGWMSSAGDGIDAQDPNKTPERAPTFRIVLENQYDWGPPWYAPTWGVVYFLYNYQDEVDGRFVYRDAFWRFVQSSGGRVGKGAVENFEEVVLADPAPPIKGVARPPGAPPVALPATAAELDLVWKDWLVRLRDEQIGKIEVARPYLQWARYALASKDPVSAAEHFEKALVAAPSDPAVLAEFARFLAERKNTDRASRLALEALRVLEAQETPDPKAISELDRLLAKWDPRRATLERLHGELASASEALVQRYAAAGLPMMVMDLSWRMGNDFELPALFRHYDEALRTSGRSLQLWELAYNEKDLAGWDAIGDTFTADGTFMRSRFGTYEEGRYDFQVLSLDKVTSGDFSLEAEVLVERGKVAFAGLVFGRKDASSFHALILFPGKAAAAASDGDGPRLPGEAPAIAGSGFVDLTSFYGADAFKIWRHTPVDASPAAVATQTAKWHKLRIDISGGIVDAWCDGELLATQEFATADVLRGTFGLITGPGEASFKDVRFLARHPRDPAARLERDLRMEKLRAASGGALGGSFQGSVPPFPAVGRWVQKPREGWDDVGPVPQLLVLWSIDQNEIIPIDAWLGALAQDYAHVGLEVVAVCSPNDDEAIDAYLAEHPFPGSLAVDRREGFGIGDTNKAYSTLRFNLPRLILLDVDRKVVWEGDPGFAIGQPWEPGIPTYLDTPLDDLIARHRLPRLQAWLQRWNETGSPRLREGDLAAALALLREAGEFERGLLSAVDDARRKLEALQATVESLKTTGESLAREGRQPALAVLVEWAALLERPVGKRELQELKPVLESGESKDWSSALKLGEAWRKAARKEPVPEQARELVAKLEGMRGIFPRELAERLRPHAEAGDLEAFGRELEAAALMPGAWLAREHFAW